MSTPRWLRERRRLLRAYERFPRRYIFTPTPTPQPTEVPDWFRHALQGGPAA